MMVVGRLGMTRRELARAMGASLGIGVAAAMFGRVPAFAAQYPELSRMGSIGLALEYEGNPVSGGALTVTRVADIVGTDAGYVFVPLESLGVDGLAMAVESGALDSAELAEEVASAVVEAGLEGVDAPVDASGHVVFEPLVPALYLVSQSEGDACTGFEPISPFLVSLPYYEDGAYVYDVDATPKPAVLRETPETPPNPPTPPEPEEPPGEEPPGEEPPGEEPPKEPPSEEKLPQTGQLNWPIPVLAGVGAVVFAAGWVTRWRDQGGDAGDE